MKNNFDLKKFLTENKLTTNTRQIVNENIEAFSDTIQVVGYPETVEDALKVIERYERDRDPVSREEAKEIVADMRATDDDAFDRNITNLIVKAFNIKLKGVSEKKGKDHDQEIISYIADTYIQNAKDGDRAYDGFRDLHISDAVQDVIGILQDPKHPLHAATKEEYAIVTKDKARGIFEKKGNLKERNDIVSTKELDAAAAFKDAGIDMSQPVLVLTQDGGHGGQETKGTVSAEEALSMFNNLRAQALESGKEDHYEFDNEIGFSAEGYEYKVAYFEEESTTTALMQKASTKSSVKKEAWGFQSDFAKNIEKKGGAPTAKADPKVLKVSMGKNAEQEQKVIDIARNAIALMDEQPKTSAEEALKSVLGI